jgi:hypothetical protein
MDGWSVGVIDYSVTKKVVAACLLGISNLKRE